VALRGHRFIIGRLGQTAARCQEVHFFYFPYKNINGDYFRIELSG
jgi:hypothetical protein